MSLFRSADNQPQINPQVVEQAMLWAVTLQSGTASGAEQAACMAWRQAAAEHELAWQRIMGLTQDLRSATGSLPGRHTRQLLKSRSQHSRRALLKGVAGLGVVAAGGWGAHERVLLPELFSDYRTSTGERRQLHLASLDLQLDTQTLLDIDSEQGEHRLNLTRGRLLVDAAPDGALSIRTTNGLVRALPGAKLMISHQLRNAPDTLVQVLRGSALLQPQRGQPLSLTAQLQSRFDLRQAMQAQALPVSASAWSTGQLIAERTRLAEVVAELDRYRRGVLRCDPAVAELLVSGAFSLDRPEASLQLLSRTLPIRVNRVLGYWASVEAA